VKVIVARPPNFKEINDKFHVAGLPVIFTWGPFIFNPENTKVTRELHAHEEIHSEQQGLEDSKILDWWDRYIVHPEFRLSQEIPAHRAEYKAFCKRHGASFARAKYLNHAARRLASPLYGNLLPFDAAHRVLVQA
jgi:hypothetical protein